MSAEIGIINKYGIALASDSAVTVEGGQRYYTTANKLFALSKYQPVAIMIYSNADYMGIPMEVIVKEYRKSLGDKFFEKLNDYWSDFINYLSAFSEKRLQNWKDYYLNEIENFFQYVKSKIEDEVNSYYDELVESDNEWNQEDINKNITNIRSDVVLEFYNQYKKMENDDLFIDLYKEIKDSIKIELKELIDFTFGREIARRDINKLKECAIMILTRKHKLGSRTGIVISGYGDDEIFPSIVSGEFMGFFFGKLKYFITNEGSLNDCEGAIYPFAQSDVVNTFITGIDNTMIAEIMKTIDASDIFSKCLDGRDCKDRLKKEIFNKIQEASEDYHINPIVNTISTAPKEELAQMAETLVNITSFRRRLSFDEYSQTVGGPIDVLLITKGDGLVWLKRKQYFNKELNYNFLHNYYKD